jgi:hypothetical protein
MNRIVVAVLIGWLAGEMREFIYNGGFSNVLAFNLLRILFLVFILTGIMAISIVGNSMRVTTPVDDSDRPEPPRPLKTSRQGSKSPIRVTRIHRTF